MNGEAVCRIRGLLNIYLFIALVVQSHVIPSHSPSLGHKDLYIVKSQGNGILEKYQK